ncbi:MAG: mannose-1-phosphate guanylyltransferase, partial [Desulfosporosinus sp.]
VLLDTVNTYIISNEKTVALVGIKDLIIVDDGDSLLICHKSRAQEIKKVVQALSDQGFEHVL